MRRPLAFLLGFFLWYSLAWSQVPASDNEYKILYRKEWTLDILLHSNNSWGVGFRKGVHPSYYRHKIYEIELLGMKDPKEVSTQNPIFNNARQYVYGRLNSPYMLHLGIGRQKVLNTKPYWGGVEVRTLFTGGFSLGIAVPDYLYVIKDLDNYGNYNLAIERYDPVNHLQDNIYGAGPMFKGIGETSFYPGLYAKAGLNFEFGSFDQTVWALEFGGFLDAYAKGIPVMAYNPARNLFASFYLSLHIGKRGN